MEAFLFYIKVSNSLVIAEMKISEVLNLGANVTVMDGINAANVTDLVFLLATICLTSCLMLAFSLFISAKEEDKNNHDEIMHKSIIFLVYGFLTSAFIIVLIIFSSFTKPLVFLILVLFLLYIIDIQTRIKKQSFFIYLLQGFKTQTISCVSLLYFLCALSLLFAIINTQIFKSVLLSFESIIFILVLFICIKYSKKQKKENPKAIEAPGAKKHWWKFW
jgi:hypothetical protein